MKKLTLPLSDKDIRTLKAGQNVLLAGRLYTARDAPFNEKMVKRV